MAETWDDAAIHDGRDRPFGLHRGIGSLIEDAPHLAIAFGAAVTVVDARALLVAGAGAHPGREMFREEGGRRRTDFRDGSGPSPVENRVGVTLQPTG